MSWEALAAISSLLTAIIIGLTAVIAMIQIRHLRTAAQLQSFIDLMNEAFGPQMISAGAYVEKVLPERLKDEAYRRELVEGRYDFEKHQELVLGAFWEKVGTLIHFRVIQADVFLDFAANTCPYHWGLLKDVTELRRQRVPRIWERFEQLVSMCNAYIAKGKLD